MQIRVFDNAPDKWEDFVNNHTAGKLYHLARWNELIRDTFGHKVKYLVLEHSNQIQGILPLVEFRSWFFGKFSVSLPFVNYGGPLVVSPARGSDFASYLIKYRKDSDLDFVELKMDSAFETDLPFKKHKVTFLMDLPDNPDELYNSIKSKVRSQIRRPMKEGIYAKAGSENLLDDYYKVYSINMRDLGTPALPKTFFRNILQKFPDNSFIVCAYSGKDKPVACSFLIKYKKVCEIPWASSLREYNRFSPNMLVYWESFRLSIQNDCGLFDFGRCTPGSGTYRFKKQWGSNEKQLYWYYVVKDGEKLPEINPNNPKYDRVIKLWQRLPYSITNFLSPYIIRHIP